MSNSKDLTLVLGGNGKTGRRVASRLVQRGREVRIGSRSGAPPFDWEARRTWAAALRGVGAVYLTYQPDLAMPGAAAAIHGFTEQAVASGVRRIVLLSGRGEDGVLPSEQAVRDSGVRFTILRAAFFCQNFSEGLLLEPVRSGELAFPAGDVAEPFVDAEDIADVAVAALTEDGHAGETYELTGPRLLTFAEACAEMTKAAGREVRCAEISRAPGREIRYVPITSQEYAALLAPHLPPDTVAFLTDLFDQLLDGHNAHLADGVERALGRRPRDFAEYARAAAATGAWSA